MVTIDWLGHSSVRLTGTQRVYVDPWKLRPGAPPADLILITHAHDDHCSTADVARLMTPATVVAAPPDCNLPAGFVAVRPGAAYTLAGLSVTTIPAYTPTKPFHPRASNWVGLVITLDGERIYITGDTDHVPEMDAVRADTLILPVGGTYTMNADEAAVYANAVRPQLAIPIHWGDVVGTRADAERFAARCTVPVTVPEPVA